MPIRYVSFEMIFATFEFPFSIYNTIGIFSSFTKLIKYVNVFVLGSVSVLQPLSINYYNKPNDNSYNWGNRILYMDV